jgi:hypothetical protein
MTLGVTRKWTLRLEYVMTPPEPITLKKQYALIPRAFEDEIMDMFLRPNPFAPKRDLAYWQNLEQVAIYNAHPRRAIPRRIRQAIWNFRYDLARRLYPDNFYDRDDD